MTRKSALLVVSLRLTMYAAEVAPDPELVVRSGHSGQVHLLAFTADNRIIISGGDDGDIRFWDAGRGTFLRRVAAHAGSVTDLATCADGTVIASTGADGMLRLWSFETGRKLAESRIEAASHIAWLGDCQHLAVSGAQGIAIVDLKNSSAQPRILVSAEAIITLRYVSAQHLLIAGTGYSNSLLAWNTATWDALPRVATPPEDRPDNLIAASSGRGLASFTTRSLTSLDPQTRKPLHRVDTFSGLSAAAMTADGSAVWTADNRKITCWSTATLEKKLDFEFADIAVSAALSPDGKQFAIGGVPGNIHVFDLEKRRESFEIAGGGVTIGNVEFTPLGTLRVFGASGNAARIWDIGNIEQVTTLPGSFSGVRASAAGTDGSYLVTSAPLQMIWWDLEPGPVPHEVKTQTINAWPLACIPNGHCAWEENDQNSSWIALADIRHGGEQPRHFDLQRAAAVALALSPDGAWLAAATNEPRVRVWSVREGVERNALPMETGSTAGALLATLASRKLILINPDMPTAVAFSPDGKWLAAGNGKSVELWDVPAFVLRRTFAIDADAAALAFSSDGKLACSLEGGGIRIWDVNKPASEIRLGEGTETADILVFRRDARVLATASAYGVVLWDVQTQGVLAEIAFSGDGWVATSPGGAFDASRHAWDQAAWRLDGKTRSLSPVESYVRDYFAPGLIADLLAGRKLELRKPLGTLDRRLPRVEIAPLQKFVPGLSKIKVRISASNEGSSAVYDLHIYRNGRLIRRVDGSLGKSFSRDFEVALPPGNNEITGTAFNKDGLQSERARLWLPETRTMYPAAEVTLHVLAIGINEYADSSLNLRFATSDAEAVAEALNFSQEDVRRAGTAAPANVRLSGPPTTMAWKTAIHIVKDRDATRAGILAAIREVAAHSGPSDAVVIFYAGHSAAIGERFYLLPHDVKLSTGGEKVEGAISDQDLESALGSMDAAHVALILDSCNSGKVVDARDRRGPLNARGLARLTYDKGMWVLTASQSAEQAKEETGLQHGLLTYALVEDGIRNWKADAAGSGEIELGAWLRYAANRVPVLAREVHENRTRGAALPGQTETRQTPQFVADPQSEREELILRVKTAHH